MKSSLIFLVGPTASGKSELALQLASELKAEIISADSMLVYRTMDIGTAKPSLEERARIPHHFVDWKDPGEEFSSFEYCTRVRELLARKESQEKNFLVVGGSGFYVNALLHGISGKPGANLQLREKLLKEAEEKGVETLRAKLRETDPHYAEIAQDTRRVVRALEVYEMTGRTMTEWDTETKGLLSPDSPYPLRLFGLRWQKEALKRRIEKRTERMLSSGLLEEVKRLAAGAWSRTAKQAIGYSEVLKILAGEIPREELGPLIVKNTLSLARRQMTWFKREKGIVWFDLERESDLDRAKMEIIKICEQSPVINPLSPGFENATR